MADESDNQSNNQSDNQSNDQSNQQNNTGVGATTGKKIVVGIDTGGNDDEGYMKTVAEGLKSCGNDVTTTQVGPNQESYMKGHGADMGVFLCNGVAPATMWSFVNAIKAGSLPYTIFALEGWYGSDPNGTLASMENVRAVSFEPEWDAGQFMTSSSIAQMQADANGAKTIGEWADMNSQYFSLCYAKTPEEMAQNICSGNCGGGGTSGSMVDSGGGAQIKDKTFEQCIRRICAATDSVFLVENNAAVLFPYVDWLAFTLREKVQTITPKEIDPDVFMMEYQTQGTYNKVTIAWGGTSLPERFPDNELMHKKYLEAQKAKAEEEAQKPKTTQNNTKTKQKNRTETTTKKSQTTRKMSTDSDGNNLLSEQYDSLVKKYGELEKRIETPVEDLETAQYMVNALLIQYVRDFNNACQCRSLANRKYIGGTFYVVTNPFTQEKEMFYLNGYTVRTQKDEPIYFDLDFRYGPESAEDLLDLQTVTVGGASSGGDSGVMGGEAADINEIAKIACKGITDPLAKAKAIHEYLRQYIRYAYYECSKEEWGKDPSKIWQAIKNQKAQTNCADTANLTSAVMRAAGLNAYVVHGPNHFWTEIDINGQKYVSDLVWSEGQLSGRPFNEVYHNLTSDSKCGNTASC